MEASNPFTEQARLMIALLPQVAKQTCFALKGGTAINLFIRDMPRLSVDIDLAYLPVEDRQTSLTNIDKALAAIATDIEQHIAGASVRASSLKETGKRYKLLVWQGRDQCKDRSLSGLARQCIPGRVRRVVCQGTRSLRICPREIA